MIKFRMNAGRGETDERVDGKNVLRAVDPPRGARGAREIIKKLVGDFAHPSRTSSPRRRKKKKSKGEKRRKGGNTGTPA